jgi:hypothetical protein
MRWSYVAQALLTVFFTFPVVAMMPEMWPDLMFERVALQAGIYVLGGWTLSGWMIGTVKRQWEQSDKETK